MTSHIDRANLRRCIACGHYHPLENLCGQTFRAGTHRFHLCIPCWRKDSEPRLCVACGKPLTLDNIDLRRLDNGGYRVDTLRCMQCLWKRTAARQKIKHFRRVYPHIIKTNE